MTHRIRLIQPVQTWCGFGLPIGTVLEVPNGLAEHIIANRWAETDRIDEPDTDDPAEDWFHEDGVWATPEDEGDETPDEIGDETPDETDEPE